MNHLKTYEGFFKNIKFKQEDPIQINLKDVEGTISDCLIDLQDDGFEVEISKKITDVYFLNHIDGRGQSSVSFAGGKLRCVFLVRINKHPEDVIIEPYGYVSEDYPEFSVSEIKKSIDFLSSLLEDKYKLFTSYSHVSDYTKVKNFYLTIDLPDSVNANEFGAL